MRSKTKLYQSFAKILTICILFPQVQVLAQENVNDTIDDSLVVSEGAVEINLLKSVTNQNNFLCKNYCYIDVDTGVITGFDSHYIKTDTETVYYDDNNIRNTVVPTAIGDNAANNSSSYLRYVELSDTIESIGSRAFADCKSLEVIKIPNSVTYIADNAFEAANANMKVFCDKGSYADNSIFYPDGVEIIYDVPALSNAESELMPEVAENSIIRNAEGKMNSIRITPRLEVTPNSEIYINIDNGSFDEELVEECAFKTKVTETGWEEIMADMADGRILEDVMQNYIGSESSNELPYKIEYIDSKTLKVRLCPLIGKYAWIENMNYMITRGTPVYNINLPAVSGNKSGKVTLSIDGNKTSVESCDSIIYAYNGEYGEKEYNKISSQYAEREVSVSANQPIVYNNQPNAIVIKPMFEISKGNYVYIKIKNGVFDENMVNDCEFKTNVTETTFDEIIKDDGSPSNILEEYIIGQQSRQLPYKIEYIDSTTLKCYLYPIEGDFLNYSNDLGVPVYRIALPAVAGNEDGYTQIAIDGKNSSISNGGWYTIARVNLSEADYDNVYKWKNYYTVSAVMNVESGSNILYYGKPVALKIKPNIGVGKSESILLNIKNGRFNEDLFEECNYKTKTSHTTYNELANMLEKGMPLYNILYKYIYTESSNELPYKLEYIDEDTLRVLLFPIEDISVGKGNYVTTINPIYNILLPVVAGENNGDITIAVDGNGSTIQTSGWYNIGKVVGGKEIIIGDISGDENVTAVDAMLIAQLASGKRNGSEMYSKADINGDGKVSAVDAMLVARFASGKIDKL